MKSIIVFLFLVFSSMGYCQELNPKAFDLNYQNGEGFGLLFTHSLYNGNVYWRRLAKANTYLEKVVDLNKRVRVIAYAQKTNNGKRFRRHGYCEKFNRKGDVIWSGYYYKGRKDKKGKFNDDFKSQLFNTSILS